MCDLFDAYLETQDLIDGEYRERAAEAYGKLGLTDEKSLRFVVTRNYIAGMTDPFAITQHARLFMSSEQIRFS